ncbi:MAG: signal recognition particle protein [Blastocatellia bacterium]|nr:signal recognition particle protein [Chloracidobacterium sp.]MBL8183678.1 signal recognition particle protein [Blastocatellia bacterium]HBE82900.1 signal recognition particle protein [Blastocatellia bacterium]HRJ87926.1 signal recognition particle protein [Pyrinomonadaceae bacterium]HRK51853.1 signal recognition particle protein [Pyrinomonadaceae bacterium]
MFESLSDKLKKTLKNLRGQGKLTPEHVDAALREIRMALLEADVNYKVAKDFVESVRAKAEGQEVWQGLNPHEQVVKIVYDELVALMGGTSSRLVFTKQTPNVVMIVGLQGSGKTTSTGKISRWLRDNQERKPLLVSVDVYRPAAREQLRVVGGAVGVPVFQDKETNDPLTLVRGAMKHAQEMGFDTLMIDTAGRLHIDDELMSELEQIKAETKPIEVLFVADAMTGQDAVRSAEVFHERVGITGVVLTKMDGDARGGAALSIKQVIGQPVKFVGVGEKYDAIEPFYPDRVAQRILGMGDVLTLIEEVQGKIDEQEAQAQLMKMTRNQFTLEDFRSQLGQFKKLGSMSKLMKMLPEQMTGGLSLSEEQSAEVDHQMKRTEAIIDSMTRAERNDHKLLDASRKTRIAGGSGTTISEVNQLLRQYEQMRKMMAQMNKGGLFGGLGRKMVGGLAGGLGGMMGGSNGIGGLGGLLGSGMESDDDSSGSAPRSVKKKKRHKKRK